MLKNDVSKMLTIRQQIWVSQMIGNWYRKWKEKNLCESLQRELSKALHDLKNILCEINDGQYNTLEALLQIEQECDKLKNTVAASEQRSV